jgi:hypothetical protein
VRGNDDKTGVNGAAPRMHHQGVVGAVVDVRDRTLLEDVRPVAWNRREQRSQIRHRPDAGLMVEAHGRQAHAGHPVHRGRVKTRRGRLGCHLGECGTVVIVGIVEPAGEVSGNPAETAVDLVPGDDLRHLVECREASIPDGLGLGPAEARDQLREGLIAHSRQVRRRVTGITGAATVTLEKGHGEPGVLHQARSGNTGEASTDDHNIDGQIAIQRWEREPRNA